MNMTEKNMTEVLFKVMDFNRRDKKRRIEFTVSGEKEDTCLTVYDRKSYKNRSAYIYDEEFDEVVKDLDKWAKEKIPS